MALGESTARARQDDRGAFGRFLLDSGKLNEGGLARATYLAGESQERLETVLTRLGLISERDLADAFASFLKITIAAPGDFPAVPIFEEKLSRAFLKQSQVIPLSESDSEIAIAAVNPLNGYALDAVRFALGRPVAVRVAYPTDFDAAFERLYGEGKSQISQILVDAEDRAHDGASDDVDKLKDIASEAPVIRLVNLLIARAVEARASDIHIEPMENELRVRYRIDGVLQQVESPPQRLSSAVISRVKIMAKLNIAERRLAQDGRIGMAVRGKDIDLRVATVPTIHGESVVLRILDRGHLDLDFAALGFDAEVATPVRDMLARPYGIFLVTGPTGSGKTTTLYTALLELNTVDKKILTIEDPIEYHLPGINQVQVKPQIGLTFASALRSFLRQDPDIMMIGEIRDLETAQIAVQAALTGHVILSTLHTNDAASAITRLLDMGVEDYLLTSTVNGVAAQRLVRTLCPHCREPFTPVAEIVRKLGLDRLAAGPITLHRAKGCEHCNHTGYRGRASIAEVLPMTDAIRQVVLKSPDAGGIQALALAGGMQTMHSHGLKKALAGITTVEEVIRVTRAI
ncbi:MAG TPA: type II secretion system ATPase GspE [Rhizomicrobium sp.]|nr:type II secretion system ATPase GspE [Rhizomicrobium sp.]